MHANRSAGGGREPSVLTESAGIGAGDLFRATDGRLFRGDRSRVASRDSDSLSLRSFVRIAPDQNVPDHA